MPVSYYVQLIVTLALLIGVLFVVLKWGKRAYDKKYSGDIKIVDKVPLDSNVSLVVAEVRQEVFLLGLGNKGLSMLAKLDSKPKAVEPKEGGL